MMCSIFYGYPAHLLLFLPFYGFFPRPVFDRLYIERVLLFVGSCVPWSVFSMGTFNAFGLELDGDFFLPFVFIFKIFFCE